ncbi:MAG: FeoB-associated Cys-rich membrane protein [Clostridiales bacterium]|nr:FeoB-associated Cys-rich membrane protein [Clostridiales bacterium]
MATWIVGGALLVIVGAIVYKMIKDKKANKNSCGCDCSNCAGGCH